jgi:hypothetical protein
MTKCHAVSLLSFLLLAVAAATSSWLLFAQGPRFTQEQCNLLKDGMSEEEVIATLGCSPDHCVDGKYFIGGLGGSIHSRNWDDCVVKTWNRRDMSISIAFDRDGRSAGIAQRCYYRIEPPSFWTWMKDIVGKG